MEGMRASTTDRRFQPRSEETKAKISASNLGRKRTEEQRQRVSDGLRRKWQELRVKPPEPGTVPDVQWTDFGAKGGIRTLRTCVANTQALMTAYGLRVAYDAKTKAILYTAPQLTLLPGREAKAFEAWVCELAKRHGYQVGIQSVRQHVLLLVSHCSVTTAS